MKTLFFVLSVALLSSPAHSAEKPACAPNFDSNPRVSNESAPSGDAIYRVVKNYGGKYVFGLVIDQVVGEIPGFDGARYQLQVTLNGKTARITGFEYCTSVGASVYSSSCDVHKTGGWEGSVAQQLFTYAANGDHLNAWDIEIHGVRKDGSVDPVGKKIRFPQKKFSELSFDQ